MLDAAIRIVARFLAATGLWAALCLPALAASHLVTGNGFGFAVVAPGSGVATKFYPHPHSFVRPDLSNALSEGIETANFVKSLGWGKAGPGSADYLNDSHVIQLRTSGGTGYFFMPFGLDRPALIISMNTAPWRVEWQHPLRSQRVLGAGARLLRFDGIEESLLAIPLSAVKKASSAQPLAASSAWALVALEKESDAEPAIRDVVRWSAGLSAKQLVSRELAEFERWRVKPSVKF
ncbi:MAG: hypothetical protein QOF34_156, partial [Sphingomonadales bacterium]|nr:hypothetical protein [Sphingomonadales bacterium]